MISLKTLNRRAGSVFAVAALVLSTALPGLASAATVTERSIELSDATKNAASADYKVSFKTDAGTSSTKAFVVDFCGNSPVIGEACDTSGLTGFSVAAVETTAPDAVTAVGATTVKVTLDQAVAGGGAVTIDLKKIHNPATASTVYARIATYADAAAMNAAAPAGYDSPATTAGLGTNVQDTGAVALAYNDGIAVNAIVQESLQFCMSKGTIDDNCDFTGANPYQAPILKLGNEIETGVFAIDSQDLYTGVVNTQLSTNASSGAVVRMKSNATCAGLHRAGAASNLCEIAAAGNTGTFAAGTPKFGVMTGAATAVGEVAASGILQPAATGSYNATDYRFDPTGVMGAYGDLLLDTNNLPANNRNMPLTFGVSAANNTPAGNYSAALSLIATGKF